MTSTERKVNKILNEIHIFEQGAVPANNSITLCVTLVGVNRIFNFGHREKKATCGRGEQTFQKCFWTKMYSQES